MGDLGNSQEQAKFVRVSDKAYGEHKQDAIPKDATGGHEEAGMGSKLPMPNTKCPTSGCNKG